MMFEGGKPGLSSIECFFAVSGLGTSWAGVAWIFLARISQIVVVQKPSFPNSVFFEVPPFRPENPFRKEVPT